MGALVVQPQSVAGIPQHFSNSSGKAEGLTFLLTDCTDKSQFDISRL